MSITVITWPQAMNSELGLRRSMTWRDTSASITYIRPPLFHELEELKWNAAINEHHQTQKVNN